MFIVFFSFVVLGGERETHDMKKEKVRIERGWKNGEEISGPCWCLEEGMVEEALMNADGSGLEGEGSEQAKHGGRRSVYKGDLLV